MGLLKSIRRWLDSEIKIRVDKGNQIKLPCKKNFRTLDIKISGRGNIVEIGDIGGYNNELTIHVYGNDNVVKIGEHNGFHASVKIGYWKMPVTGAIFEIKKGYSIGGADFVMMEDKSKISIGRDCLMSTGIAIWCTDTHSIFDETGKLLNEGKSVEIGDHVWIGKDVHICKNSSIGNNCVVGWRSVVTGHHPENNSILAGVPAKVVKRGINWDTKGPKEYLDCYHSENFAKKAE